MVAAPLALSTLILAAVSAIAQTPGSQPEDLSAALTKVDMAQTELVQGHPEPFKALWSHRDDVTLIGGLGGSIETGWDRVSQRLDWVASQYSHTSTRRGLARGERQPRLCRAARSDPVSYSCHRTRIGARTEGDDGHADAQLVPGAVDPKTLSGASLHGSYILVTQKLSLGELRRSFERRGGAKIPDPLQIGMPAEIDVDTQAHE